MANELHQEWLDTRAKLWEDAKKFNSSVIAEKRDMSPEEDSKWDAMNADIDSLTAKIDRQNRLDECDRKLSEERAAQAPPPTASAERQQRREVETTSRKVADGFRAFHGWALNATGRGDKITDQHIDSCKRTGQKMDAEWFDIELAPMYDVVRRNLGPGGYEKRFDVETQATTEGLEWIPIGFVRELERSMLAFGGMRQVSRVIRTPSGQDLKWPTTNDTGNTGRLLAEEGALTVVSPASAAMTLEAYKYSSDAIKVSAEFLEDEEINFTGIVAGLLGERLGRITNTHFTTGTGTAQPNGVVTATNAGVTLTLSTLTDHLHASAMFDLYHSVDPAYRNGANFMMHDTQVATLRKLVDTSGGAGLGNFIWQPGLQAGTPDRLLGVPVVVNQDMESAFLNGDFPYLFGDFSKYIIRDVSTIRIRRLTELYAATDQEGFIAFSRHDGDLLDSGTDPIKHLVLTT